MSQEVDLNQPGIIGIMAGQLEAMKAAGYRPIRQLDGDTWACWKPGFGPAEAPANAPSSARGTSAATAARSGRRIFVDPAKEGGE
jgi:hypothetical protein